jgi:hypothetical protein
MAVKVKRTTVDLSAYPDLVVIYLGMRVNSLRGIKTLARLGPGIKAAVDAKLESRVRVSSGNLHRERLS